MKKLTKFKLSQKSLLLIALGLLTSVSTADIVHNDDVVARRTCSSAASSCLNGETFNPPGPIGTTDIKIEESLPNIWLQDTDADDWVIAVDINQLISAVSNNAFSIYSQSGNSNPFIIDASVSTTGMLTIDSNERVGIGTQTPGETLEVASTQPGFRLNDTNGGQADIEVTGNFLVVQNTANTKVINMEINGGGTQSNQLYFDSDGDVSVGGIANPTHALHVKSDGSDYIVFDGSTQDWSWHVNNSYMSLMNHTAGDHTFRIYPSNSGDNGLVLRNNKVGVNNLSPTASIHVKDSITDMLLLENTHATTGIRKLMRMSNKGAVGFEMVDRSIPSPGLDGRTWQFRSDGVGNFIVNQPQFPGAELQLQNDGDLFVKGTVTANGMNLGSSRAIKTDFSEVKGTEVMQKLAKINIEEWRYKQADNNDRHISPMAEDFYSLFKLGPDNKHINPADLASVALIAAKELQKNTHSLEVKTKALEAENSTLKNRLLALEKLVTNLASGADMLPETGRKVTLLK